MKKLFIALLILSTLCAHAQDAPTNPAGGKLREIAVALDSFWNKIPVEKIHIQFDKPYYTLGDTIWMKAYLVNESNELSPLSKILYAELIDEHDSVKVSLRLPVTAGLAWGAITLTDSLLAPGNYHLRAYTNLMRNFGNEYFFNKTIRIGEASSPFAASPSSAAALAYANRAAFLQKDSTGVRIQFFPEGGDMVTGLSAKVAFKAVGIDGLGRNISGIVVDKDNKQVAAFQSEHAGMGAFVLEPGSGNTYSAVIRFADGSEKKVTLPVAVNSGYSLAVNQNKDNVIIKITAGSGLLNLGEIMLVAQSANAVQYTGAKKLTQPSFTSVLPKSRFPEGILQFTLFSADKKPVAERLVFIRHDEQHLKISVLPDQADYKQRDKVHLNLQVTDQQGKPAPGVFSLAVTDEGKVPYGEADEKTIFSNLLLTSDLKGFVEHPNYYFMDTSAVRARQLDNLLLTQGWRRFVWKDILSGEMPALAYQPENGMGIGGKVLNNRGKVVPFAKVHVLASVGEGLLLDTVADAQGRFNFDDLAFGKDVKFNVAATDAKGKKNVTVEMDKDKSPLPPGVEHIPVEMLLKDDVIAMQQSNGKPAEIGKPLSMTNRMNTLNEVVIKEKKKTVEEVALQFKDPFSRPTQQVFTFVDLANAATLPNYLINRIGNGIHIIPEDAAGNFHATRLIGSPKITVDGQKPGRGELGAISPQQIAAVDITDDGIAILLKRSGVDYQSYIDAAEKEKQAEISKTIALKEVAITAKREATVKAVAVKNSANLRGAGNADIVLTFVDIANCSDLGTCLISRLPGIQIQTSGKLGAAWRAVSRGVAMKVYIDGQPRDASTVAALSPGDISSIEVLRDPGEIYITTKRGDVDYQSYIAAAEKEKEEAIAKTINLKEIVITDKKKLANIQSIATKNSASLAGPGSADQVLTFVDLLVCQYSLAECLQGRLTNVQVKDGNAFARNFDSPMYVVVDGVAGRELGSIMSSDVSSVEVLRGGGAAALYGSKGANGVLIITTKRGDIDYDSYTPGYHRITASKPALVNYKFQNGYDLRRQFYSPDYTNPATNKDLADARTTIYWNPNIITDESGKASVEFFNADGKGSYKLITEGLDMQGKLGREVYKYMVK